MAAMKQVKYRDGVKTLDCPRCLYTCATEWKFCPSCGKDLRK
jgi:rubrerythrin